MNCRVSHTLPLTALNCTAFLWTKMHFIALHFTALHCNALNSKHCTLHCTAMHCTALHCTAKPCTMLQVLHFIAMHCTALQCAKQRAKEYTKEKCHKVLKKRRISLYLCYNPHTSRELVSPIWKILPLRSVGIGATIRTRQEIQWSKQAGLICFTF